MLITPEQAYELLKRFQADLAQTMLMAPDASDGPEAIDQYDSDIAHMRAMIGLLENYSSDAPPDLTKPF